LFNLSKLAVWWLRLGIGIERIRPGHPQQNGRHEQMHLTLKKETTKPAAASFLQQQAKFDDFIDIFNHQSPHEALDMKCPAEVYQPSTRPYQGLPDIDYPTKSWWSLTAAGSVSGAKRSTSAPYSPTRRSASRRYTMISGWLALWTMI
jgi:Integrase core domain